MDIEKGSLSPDRIESKRLAALRRLGILDTPTEERFDGIVRLAANVCHTPFAMMTLLDEERQWFKATHGLGIRETPRNISFCAHTVKAQSDFEILNALEDDRFRKNPLVTSDPAIRYYFGVPLMDSDGNALGALAVADQSPRQLSEVQKGDLRVLAAHLMSELELRQERAEGEQMVRRLTLLQEVAGIGSWEFTPSDGKWLCSDETLRIFGLEGDDPSLSQDSFWERVHPDDVKELRKRWEEALLTLQSFEAECRVLHPDKGVRSIRLKIRYLSEAGLSPSRFVGAIQDITEQREVSEALIRQDTLLRMASKVARFGAWSYEVQSAKLYWSEELYQIHEVEVDCPVDVESGIRFYTPDSQNEIRQHFSTCLKDGTPFDLELQIITGKGNRRWVRSVGGAVSDEAGRIVRVEGAFQDIHVRKEIEVSLEETQRKLYTLINNLPGMVYRCLGSENWPMVYISEGVEAVTGYRPAQLMGVGKLKYGDLILEEDFQNVSTSIERAVQEKRQFQLSYRIRTLSGEERWVWEQGVGVYDEKGQLRFLEGIIFDTSEQHLAEHARQQIESRLTDTLEAMSDAFFLLNRNWEFTYLNREAEQLLESSREALLGENVWEKFPHARGTIYQESYEKALREEVTVHFESLYDPLGKIFDVRAFPVPEGLAVYFQDITEKHHQENERREHAERFRILSHATNDAIWDWDLKEDRVWWSDGFEKLFGHSRAQIDPSSKGWTDYIHPDDVLRVSNSIHEVIDSPNMSEWEAEYRFLCWDGSYAYVLNRGYVIRDPIGKGIRMVGGMTDLTERKAAEDRLIEQSALLDQAQDAILVWDTDLRLYYINNSAEKLFSSDSEKMLHKHLDKLAAFNADKVREAMEAVLKKGEWQGELKFKDSGGTKRVLQSRWTLMVDRDLKPIRILSINTDMTESKKLEEQFLRAQRLESIGTLAGGIAHDLNNLLAPIVMGMELLKRKENNPSVRDVIREIEASARRGADLVRQVLSFARGVEGERMPLQLTHLIAEIESIVANTFPKNIRFHAEAIKGLWVVEGDPTQLSQVLLNLCVNARDAMPDGGRLVLEMQNIEVDPQYASMHPEAVPGRYACIEVTDEGVGMPPHVIERLFEPFFTTKVLGKGTGLGLSTVRGIIKSHGGFIKVYSEPGKGSCFKVFIPAVDESIEAIIQRSESTAALPRGSGQLILVVDDEGSILNITRQTLEAFGYRVLTAEDGAQAIGIFATNQGQIALILTDMMMPVMDGPALISAIKRIDPEVPLIAASGLNANGNVSKAANLGVKFFLPKPYTAERLVRLIDEVLRQSEINGDEA